MSSLAPIPSAGADNRIQGQEAPADYLAVASVGERFEALAGTVGSVAAALRGPRYDESDAETRTFLEYRTAQEGEDEAPPPVR